MEHIVQNHKLVIVNTSDIGRNVKFMILYYLLHLVYCLRMYVEPDLSACLNPIRSGVFQRANNPVGGGALKAPPPTPHDLENYCINPHHIIRVHFTRCFRRVLIKNFQKFTIVTILQRFQNKK